MKTTKRSSHNMNTILPNFFVVGVVKGGTTSLYNYLDQHPHIFLPRIKETNYFSAGDIRADHFLPQYALDVDIDLDRYIKSGMKKQIHIAHVEHPSHYEALFHAVGEETAVGEISNSYMICPGAAKAIFNFNPEARIIVVLRNPIYRAWSQYLMNLREAKTRNAEFISELELDDAQINKGWGVNHQYLELGMYAGQLQRYYNLFDADQILPIFYEEYRENPDSVMGEISRFLNVDTDFQYNFSIENNSASLPRNASLNQWLVKSGLIQTVKRLTPKSIRKHFASALYSEKNIPRIDPNSTIWLQKYYAKDVENLASLLGSKVTELWPEFAKK